MKEVEERLEKHMNKLEHLKKELTPDELWDILNGAVKEATQAVFEKTKEKTPDYEDNKKQREELLKRRRVLRQKLDETHGEELDTLELELAVLSNRCRMTRRRQAQQMEERLIEEIWENWKDRQFSQVHRLRVQLTGHSVGPKKRYYRAAPRICLSAEEWKEALALPPGEGGMAAKDVGTWQDFQDKYKK